MEVIMNIKTTKSATEVRNNFFDILDEVKGSGIPYTITKGGVPAAVLMNAEEYEGWMETLEIMKTPELVKGIEEGKKDLREGRYSTFEEVFGMTPEQALADEGKKKYAVRKLKKK